MKGKVAIFALVAILSLALVVLTVSSVMSQGKPDAMTGQASRGHYLVTVGSCADCHSPKIMTAQGPMPDTTKALSGFPSAEKIPEMPVGVIGPDKWGGICTNDQAGWVGPWGMSFAFNLTPDKQNGTGAWTQDIFIKAMRTGKHMGAGRDILPPMPWPSLAQATDEDLAAIFSYLQSLPPIQNQVPIPIPPAGAKMPEQGKK